jgi:uncharacterized membrane protein
LLVENSHNHRRASLPLSRAFRVGLLLKAADAMLEIVGGILFLVVPPSALDRIIVALTQHQLSEDPGDRVALLLRETAQHFASGRYFGAVYLLSHGLSKVVLIVEIFRGRLWAYPAMLVLLGTFIVYQTYRLVRAFTLGIFALTLLDMIVFWLTWREYGRQRERLAPRQ